MITLEELKKAVQDDAAIRGRATLDPAGGPGDKVFPPTHSVADENRLSREEERNRGVKYARERRNIGGTAVDVVLLDSVQSQANRMEEALQALWSDGRITVPVVAVDFGADLPDLRGITSLTAPHRVSDALLRDSMIGDTPFRYTALGSSFNDTTAGNAAALFAVCPTALIFGLWDSTRPRGGLGFRLARNLTSEIVGIGVEFGTKTASRIDPAGILKKPIDIYKADAERAPKEQWTDNADLAEQKDNEPVKYGKKDKAGTATAINHSNVPPSWEVLAGGVTFDRAVQTVVLSLAGLRRLSFVDVPPVTSDGVTEARTTAHGHNDDARTVLAALALLAVTAAADRGYDLRSRCVLVPRQGAALRFERVGKDGKPVPFELDLPGALKLYADAVSALPAVLRWKVREGNDSEQMGPELSAGAPVATLRASEKLRRLVQESRKKATPDEAEDE